MEPEPLQLVLLTLWVHGAGMMQSVYLIFFIRGLQGYLAHKKPPHPRTLQKAYAWGPTVLLGGGAFSYGRGTPIGLMYTMDRYR